MEDALRRSPRARARVRQDDDRARERIAREEGQLPRTVPRVGIASRIAVLVEDDGDADEQHGRAPEAAEHAEEDEREQRVEKKQEVGGIDVGRHPAISRRARRSSFPLAVSGSAGTLRAIRGRGYPGSGAPEAAPPAAPAPAPAG